MNTSTLIEEILQVTGLVVITLAVLSWLIRTVWHRIPHPQADILHRLSELLVAVKEQTTFMKLPEAPQANPALEEFQKKAMVENERVIFALERIAGLIKKQNEYLQSFCRTLTGNDPGGYTEMTDENAKIREKAIELQRRYKNLTWEECIAKAKQIMPYEPSLDQGFGGDNV